MKNEAPKTTLNARKVETAKPRDQAYKLADGGGLYLQVNPNGSKYWRMKYRFAGKEKKFSFGTYPDITLAEARTKRDEARKVLGSVHTPTDVGKTIRHLLQYLILKKHPHGRGEDRTTTATVSGISETPPRTWGRRQGDIDIETAVRNTPTDVGKTAPSGFGHGTTQKHPHGRGEDAP